MFRSQELFPLRLCLLASAGLLNQESLSFRGYLGPKAKLILGPAEVPQWSRVATCHRHATRGFVHGGSWTAFRKPIRLLVFRGFGLVVRVRARACVGELDCTLLELTNKHPFVLHSHGAYKEHRCFRAAKCAINRMGSTVCLLMAIWSLV